MKSLVLFALLSSFAAVALAQTCQYNCPLWWEPGQLTYVGGNLFDADTGGYTCSCNLTSGDVYLFRPGDHQYTPRKVGYWNYSTTDPIITTPETGVYGYGFRVVIVPDRDSPTKEPQVSPTFTIITQEWLDKSYDQVFLEAPDPFFAADWDSTGQQMIAWSDSNSAFNSFSILLYKSSDVSWGPMVLAANVTGASSNATATEYYFTPPKPIPISPDYYQFVIVPSVEDTGKVIAVSGAITIVDYPVTTNTYPYPYPGIRTLTASQTPK